MIYLAIAAVAVPFAGVLVAVARFVSDRKSRRSDDDRAAERRAEELDRKNSLPAAILEVYRSSDAYSGSYLKVINTGLGSATDISVKFDGDSEVRLVGDGGSGAKSLIDLEPGHQTSMMTSATSDDDRIKFTLYWEDPAHSHPKEIDHRLGELPAEERTTDAILPGKFRLRPRPKPHGI